MIVCVCNNINEKKVKKAIKKGCGSPKELMTFYKTSFKCSACCKYLCEYIKEVNDGVLQPGP